MEANDRLTIKQWAVEDRPREKMVRLGAKSLSNGELLAILINTGTNTHTALEIARIVLKSANNRIGTLGALSIDELCRNNKGIGPAKAITILAALELGLRRNSEPIIERADFMCSRDIHGYFHPLLCGLAHEEFWILLLNQSHKLIASKKISGGGITETTVDTRLILQSALSCNATNIALCHNHPSGNRNPSASDNMVTQKIVNAAKLMDIRVIDHLIICDTLYYSYADEGIL